jgi:hypothetical protein
MLLIVWLEAVDSGSPRRGYVTFPAMTTGDGGWFGWTCRSSRNGVAGIDGDVRPRDVEVIPDSSVSDSLGNVCQTVVGFCWCTCGP